jgi:flagellar biosynthesis/type III secretory pathway M-ring protein FliF/YscJ
MFSKEFFELFTQIIKSWQVIAVSVVLIVYLYIVSYVSRSYHRPRVKKAKAPKVKKAEAAAAKGPEETKSSESGNTNEELGLEEQ